MPRSGLTTAAVTTAGADLADEVGFDQLSMGLLAGRLGIRTPSLYKHVSGQADLVHRIAVLATHELSDAIRDAIQGWSGRDALLAGAQAMRRYVVAHPGRYAAGDSVRATGPGDPLGPARLRVVESWGAMLRGYRLDPGREIHALRMLRSMLHGFSTVEAAGGFRYDTDLDESFTWMLHFIDRGLQATTTGRSAVAS